MIKVWKTFLFCVLLTFFNFLNKLYSQEDIVPLVTKAKLDEEVSRSGDSALFHFIIEAEDLDEIKLILERYGGWIKYSYGRFAAITIPYKVLNKIIRSGLVKEIMWRDAPPFYLTDIMKIHNKVSMLIGASFLNGEKLTGRGVIVGFVDTGIDIYHPDFRDSSGKTRILYLWDQNLPVASGKTPMPYGYGQEFTSNDINGGQCPHLDTNYWGHGTNVAGSAVSNGRAANYYSGVAPEANIITVALDFANYPMSVVDAVHYIFTKASILKMPCVVNLSIGSYGGAKDSLELPTILIDSILNSEPGRVLVCAAGNGGQFPPHHIAPNLNGDTQWVWFEIPPASLSLWADTQDIKNLYFAIGADDTLNWQFLGHSPFRNYLSFLNYTFVDTLYSKWGGKLAVIYYWAQESRGRVQVQILLSDVDSLQYRYRFMVRGFGTFDMWSHPAITGTSMLIYKTNADNALFPDLKKYIYPDSLSNIVGYWNCSPKSISVGNYINRETYVDITNTLRYLPGKAGELHPTSSRGPARKGLIKPDIIAPGSWQLTTGELSNLAKEKTQAPSNVAFTGYHKIKGGTSMAAPSVAGSIALILQKCPYINYRKVKDIILSNTYIDSLISGLSPYHIGYGKLDIYSALASLSKNPTILASKTQICSNEYAYLSAPQNFVKYKWSTGDTSQSIWVSQPGTYQLTVVDSNGCIWISQPVSITQKTPTTSYNVKTKNNDTLLCLHDTLYAYINPSTYLYLTWNNGQTTDTSIITKPGNYWAFVVDTSGCLISSDTIFVKNYTSNYFTLYYSNGVLWAPPGYTSYVWYNGTATIDTTNLNWIIPITNGYFWVVASNSNGCQDTSYPFLISGEGPHLLPLIHKIPENFYDILGKESKNLHYFSPYLIMPSRKKTIQLPY